MRPSREQRKLEEYVRPFPKFQLTKEFNSQSQREIAEDEAGNPQEGWGACGPKETARNPTSTSMYTRTTNSIPTLLVVLAVLASLLLIPPFGSRTFVRTLTFHIAQEKKSAEQVRQRTPERSPQLAPLTKKKYTSEKQKVYEHSGKWVCVQMNS